MFEEILEQIQRFESLNGTTHKSKDSKVIWSKFVQPHKTREEAIHAHNADAIKKHKTLVPVKGLDEKETIDKAANKYVDDLLQRLMDG